MRFDFDKPILDLDNKPVEDATFKTISLQALSVTFPGEENLPGEEKYKRYALAIRIINGDYECKVEEIALLKSLIGRGFTPVVVGRCFDFFEGKTDGK